MRQREPKIFKVRANAPLPQAPNETYMGVLRVIIVVCVHTYTEMYADLCM